MPNIPPQGEGIVEPPDLSKQHSSKDNQIDYGASESRKLLDEINALVGVPGGPGHGEGAETQSKLMSGPEDLECGQVLRERSVTINPKPSTAPVQSQVRQTSEYSTAQLDLVMRTGLRPVSKSAAGRREQQDKVGTQGSKLATGPAVMDQGPPVSPRHRIYQRTFPKPELQPEMRPSLAIEGKSTRNKPRSAGRAPPRAKSASRQEMILRQNEMLKRSAGPNRTAPSIPRAFQPFGARQTSGGKTFMPELEAQARKDRSPRHMMEKGQFH